MADGAIAPEGFDVSTFASRPHINSPTCITATPDGRVFVGVDPNATLGKEKGVGKIVCCEDENKDGEADKFTVFAQVDRPRGLFFNQGRLWVMHPPVLSVFTDKDGDNVADESEVLVSNISTDVTLKRGADHTTNGFAVGIDGWLYVAVGDYGLYNTQGADGEVLSHQGGGVLRVRPDGSEMEMYASGLRNIYDIAADPCLNLFTRDNTNDGGGWNVRFSHIIGGQAEYGYPKYYQNFSEDMIPCMEDYGGGSGVGALSVYEPETYPGKFGHSIYTADWGRSRVYFHDLKASGPTFEGHQAEFFEVSKVSDLDIDGLGSMYVTSFGSNFRYEEDRGDVYRLKSKTSVTSIGLDKIEELSDVELIELFNKNSHTVHQEVQFEVLRRGVSDEMIDGLQTVIKDRQLSVINRVAALFTLKQLQGMSCHSFISSLFEDRSIREYAIKALADRTSELKNVEAQQFIHFSIDDNPRVRVQVAIALGRIGGKVAVGELLKLTNDDEFFVRHLARKSLEKIRPISACLKYVETQTVHDIQGALQVLYSIYDLNVLKGLEGILDASKSEDKKMAVVKALFRLYFKEHKWNGSWWKTRPFNQGPHYKGVPWKGTALVDEILKRHISSLPKKNQMELAGDVLRNRLDAKAFGLDLPSELMIDYLPKKIASVAKLKAIAIDKDEKIEIRIKAYKVIQEISGIEALKAQIVILGDCLGENLREFESLESEFIYSTPIVDNKTVLRIFKAFIADRSKGKSGLKETKYSEITLRLLMVIKESPLGEPSIKNKINNIFDEMRDYKLLYKVIGDLKIESMRDDLLVAKDNKKVSVQAIQALKKLNDNQKNNEKKMVDFEYAHLEEELLRAKGDVGLGEKLFERQSCIVCHSVNMSQPSKGPYLGASAAMFSREDLIESILKPNANLSQGFQTVHITLKNGESRVGFVIKEVDGEVHVRDIMGVTHYLIEEEITSRTESSFSMMPTGLVNNLSLYEMASLLDYLGTLNHY